MKYHGLLYGKLAGKYIRLRYNSDTIHDLQEKLLKCRAALVIIASDETVPERIYQCAEQTLTATAPEL